MLSIYAPIENQNSKCWSVFEGIQKTWPESTQIVNNTENLVKSPAMFWGLVNLNSDIIHQLEQNKQDYYFTDTPYFGRFDNQNLKKDNHYWRFSKNNIHAKLINGCPADRFEKFNVKFEDNTTSRSHILICPSSAGIHRYLDHNTWLDDTINQIKKYTDRPIKVRIKPRGRGTSGPSEAKVPLSEDLKNAFCCVTSCSISAVESLMMRVPVFCHEKSFASEISNTDLSQIENPVYQDPTELLRGLCYQQFTPEEYENGKAVSILKDFKIL